MLGLGGGKTERGDFGGRIQDLKKGVLGKSWVVKQSDLGRFEITFLIKELYLKI